MSKSTTDSVTAVAIPDEVRSAVGTILTWAMNEAFDRLERYARS